MGAGAGAEYGEGEGTEGLTRGPRSTISVRFSTGGISRLSLPRAPCAADVDTGMMTT